MPCPSAQARGVGSRAERQALLAQELACSEKLPRPVGHSRCRASPSLSAPSPGHGTLLWRNLQLDVAHWHTGRTAGRRHVPFTGALNRPSLPSASLSAGAGSQERVPRLAIWWKVLGLGTHAISLAPGLMRHCFLIGRVAAGTQSSSAQDSSFL